MPTFKDLGLSNREINALARVGILTVNDLISLESPVKLLVKRGIGRKTYIHILSAMNHWGLQFKGPK